MPRGYFLSTRALQRLAGAFAVGCVFMLILMAGRPSFSRASVAIHGIDDPGLALQFARDPADVELILSEYPSQDRITMEFKQYEDFFFIAAYVGLFVLLGILLARRGDAWSSIAGIVAAVCGLASGVFDVLENRAILAILDVPMRDTTQSMVNAIARASIAKWALSALTLALLSTYFLRIPRWYARVAGWFAISLSVIIVGMSIYFRKIAP